MIKYLGSKRALLPRLLPLVESLPGVRSAADLFSGTARVGHALKRLGLQVTANDHNTYAHVLARCYVQADSRRVAAEAERLIAELNRLPGRPGWFTATYSEQARFFQVPNGARIEAVRDRLAAWDLSPDLEAVLLVSLMEAADRVDSTTGVQMAYLKAWSARSYEPLRLRLPELLPGPGRALPLEALAAARLVSADLVYLDPPYNQHRYRGNYHIWETLVRWDRPEVYGVACKRADCRTYRSPFNSRLRCAGALAELVDAVDCRWLIVSFSDEGYVGRQELEAVLAERGPVRVVSTAHPRYVGARIGIHNPRGVKVGQVGNLVNREYFFLVACAGQRVPTAWCEPAAAE